MFVFIKAKQERSHGAKLTWEQWGQQLSLFEVRLSLNSRGTTWVTPGSDWPLPVGRTAEALVSKSMSPDTKSPAAVTSLSCLQDHAGQTWSRVQVLHLIHVHVMSSRGDYLPLPLSGECRFPSGGCRKLWRRKKQNKIVSVCQLLIAACQRDTGQETLRPLLGKWPCLTSDQ